LGVVQNLPGHTRHLAVHAARISVLGEGMQAAEILARHHVTRHTAPDGVARKGPLVVLAHGFGCDQGMWRMVAPALAKDHAVVSFDLMGAGQSDTSHWTPERYETLHGHAQDFIALIEALGAGPVVMVGHSISSSIAMLAAIERPDLFARLIMIGPNPCFVNELPDYEGGFERSDIMELLDLMDRNMVGWAHFFAPVAMKNEGRPELQEELARSICRGDATVVRHFARVVFLSDVREAVPRLRVPALILQCAEDAVAPEAVGAYLHQRMMGSTLIQMEATGHCPHLSHPEETIRLIRQDLARLSF
jgi:sigma-B regulation protein RsbQ